MKRYFLISYSHSTGFGNGFSITPVNGYPNEGEFKRSIEDTTTAKGVLILNIVEMTKDEYEIYTFKPI